LPNKCFSSLVHVAVTVHVPLLWQYGQYLTHESGCCAHLVQPVFMIHKIPVDFYVWSPTRLSELWIPLLGHIFCSWTFTITKCFGIFHPTPQCNQVKQRLVCHNLAMSIHLMNHLWHFTFQTTTHADKVINIFFLNYPNIMHFVICPFLARTNNPKPILMQPNWRLHISLWLQTI
jgi:hypothetical protein